MQETETVNVSCQNLDRLHCLESTVHVNISKLIPMCLKDSLHEVKVSYDKYCFIYVLSVFINRKR